MVKGGLDPNFDYVIRPGKKATTASTAVDPGDVMIKNTAISPDGFKKSDAAGSILPAVVNVNRAEDAEADIEVILKGPVRVVAEEAIEAGRWVKTGAAGGVQQWDDGVDAENLKKGYFAGLHDKPVTGTPAQLQDPQTIKDAVLNDVIIVDWFGGMS